MNKRQRKKHKLEIIDSVSYSFSPMSFERKGAVLMKLADTIAEPDNVTGTVKTLDEYEQILRKKD